MKKITDIGIELPDEVLGQVQGGGPTVYSGGDYNVKVDLKPLVETAKWVWKKISSWF
jgi:hypothetical protein